VKTSYLSGLCHSQPRLDPCTLSTSINCGQSPISPVNLLRHWRAQHPLPRAATREKCVSARKNPWSAFFLLLETTLTRTIIPLYFSYLQYLSPNIRQWNEKIEDKHVEEPRMSDIRDCTKNSTMPIWHNCRLRRNLLRTQECLTLQIVPRTALHLIVTHWRAGQIYTYYTRVLSSSEKKISNECNDWVVTFLWCNCGTRVLTLAEILGQNLRTSKHYHYLMTAIQNIYS